jgi:hypothetical protein
VFAIEYRDGLRAAGFMLDGVTSDFTAAIEIEGQREPLSVLMWLQNGKPYQHFECLVRNIDRMFQTGRAAYPVERTLLTSGILDFALDSLIQGWARIPTHELDVRYQPGPESHYCRQRP